MQPWGWAGGEEAPCPNHSGCQSRILPLPSAVLGAGVTPGTGGAKQARAAPSSTGAPSSAPRAPAARALTFVTVMQELGALPGAGAACGGGGRGPPEARAAAGRGPGRLRRREAHRAAGPALRDARRSPLLSAPNVHG